MQQQPNGYSRPSHASPGQQYPPGPNYLNQYAQPVASYHYQQPTLATNKNVNTTPNPSYPTQAQPQTYYDSVPNQYHGRPPYNY